MGADLSNNQVGFATSCLWKVHLPYRQKKHQNQSLWSRGKVFCPSSEI